MDEIETLRLIDHAEDPRLRWDLRILVQERIRIVAYLACETATAPMTCYAECASIEDKTAASIASLPLAIAMARTEAIRFMNEKIRDYNASRCQALADATWVIAQASAA